jgi:hypothetical protein
MKDNDITYMAWGRIVVDCDESPSFRAYEWKLQVWSNSSKDVWDWFLDDLYDKEIYKRIPIYIVIR